jgi:hypothetical protein
MRKQTILSVGSRHGSAPTRTVVVERKKVRRSFARPNAAA